MTRFRGVVSKQLFQDLRWSTFSSLVSSATAFICGIFVVRLLSKDDYAEYAVATGAFSLVTSLANIGVSVAAGAIAGEQFPCSDKIGSILVTARRSVAWMWGWSLLIAGVFLGVSASNLQLGWISFVEIFAYAAISSYFSLISIQYISVGLVFHQLPRQSLIDIVIGFSRSLSMVGALLVAPFITPLLVINAVSEWWRARALAATEMLSIEGAEIDFTIQKRLRKTMLQLLPYGTFYALQGQILTIVLGLFGAKSSLAEVAAVGRIALIGSIISTIIGKLILPRAAKATSRVEILKLATISSAAVATVFLALLVVGYFFPQVIPMILGPHYANAGSIYSWIIFSSGLAGLGGAIWAVLMGRALVSKTWIVIPYTLGSQTIAAVLATGRTDPITFAILLGVIGSAVALLTNIWLLMTNLSKTRWQINEVSPL